MKADLNKEEAFSAVILPSKCTPLTNQIKIGMRECKTMILRCYSILGLSSSGIYKEIR